MPAAGGEVPRRGQRGEGREVRAKVDEHVSQRKGQRFVTLVPISPIIIPYALHASCKASCSCFAK